MNALKRTNADDLAFQQLVALLDKELAERDGEDHSFYAQFNKLNKIKYVVLAYHGHEAISCGAIKEYDSKTMEVKRMYTHPKYRGKGMASSVLGALEKWAQELGYEKCILETGIKQPEAIQLYQKNGYELIPNYGQYEGVADSRCFEKRIDGK